MDSREVLGQPSITRRRVSRRTILRVGGLVIAALPLATACGQPPPAPAPAAATQPPAATKPAADAKPTEQEKA